MNANDREVISGLTKQIELLQEQIKSMNEVMAKMIEKDNPKVETEEDRRKKLIEETRRHTEELNKKLEQRERNHNIAYKAKKLGEVVNNFGERVFTMDYLNTLSGFAIDEAYDNYFQDGNCKVGTKKLSDEELEKYEILFEGKKPKEEVKEDEKTKIADGFDKNINEKDPLNNLEEENDEKELSGDLIESSEKEKSKTPADPNEKDKVEAAEKAKEQVKPEGEKNIANVEEASPSLKSKIWNKLKGNLGKVGAIALPLAAIAGLLLGGIGWTAIAATAPATLAAFAGGYVAKKSGLIK